MDWIELEEKCFEITYDTIKMLLLENKDEAFYAVSLYTDSSAMSASLSASSEGKLKSILAAEEDQSIECENYYRWAVSEWFYDGYNAGAFSKISKMLREDSSREINFAKFKNELIKTLSNVLIRIKRELPIELNSTVCFVSITDDDESEEIENSSAKLINDAPLLMAFILRFD